jgi:hypothetical protein
MRFEAARFIDFFRPGDTIPAGTYDAATLAKLVARGVVVEQEFRAEQEFRIEIEEPVKDAAEQEFRAEEKPKPRRNRKAAAND